ncbi:hypothetical protein CCZ01_03730 [Helicobacter monodelphidis]|nr:hypothetical protein CCZ01_03730 [Helicobacter sp. 15-1451]
MAMELSDMLAVALHFAGVKEECLQDAMNVYVEALDYFDDNAEYNKEAMIKIIEDMKKNNKNLFF